MDPSCLQGNVQSGVCSVMVWGVCNWQEIGPLMRFDSTKAGQWFVNIISDHQHPFMACVHSEGRGESQQQPNSPDMNIMYHIWDSLPRSVLWGPPPSRISWPLCNLCRIMVRTVYRVSSQIS
ncbi:transposable element Tcb2 transposase [Trichonephila clavipes]|nr:transposable element Tcb2 transposase [Trichonephila clavipes]